MTEPAWPLSATVAAWRPERYELTSVVLVERLADADGALPSWLDPDCVDEDELVPACTLATSELDTRPGNTDGIVVLAVADRAGGYRIVVLDDYATPYVSPVKHTTTTLTTGELQQVLDGAHPEGAPAFGGITQGWRERNAVEAAQVADVAAASSVFSEVYPGIEPADEARKAAWVAAATA